MKSHSLTHTQAHVTNIQMPLHSRWRSLDCQDHLATIPFVISRARHLVPHLFSLEAITSPLSRSTFCDGHGIHLEYVVLIAAGSELRGWDRTSGIRKTIRMWREWEGILLVDEIYPHIPIVRSQNPATSCNSQEYAPAESLQNGCPLQAAIQEITQRTFWNLRGLELQIRFEPGSWQVKDHVVRMVAFLDSSKQSWSHHGL